MAPLMQSLLLQGPLLPPLPRLVGSSILCWPGSAVPSWF